MQKYKFKDQFNHFNNFEGMKIGLIFCLEAVLTSTESSAFSNYCRENRVTIYRSRLIQRDGNVNQCAKIEVYPFNLNFITNSKNPSQVILIFESRSMDRI